MVGSCVPLSLSPLCFVSDPSAENSTFLYRANFASQIDGAPPFIRGVRARLLLIQRVIDSGSVTGDLGLGGAFAILVMCSIAGQCADLATTTLWI
jgi:hypothetical protein